MRCDDLSLPYHNVVNIMDGKSLLEAESHPVRTLVYRILKILSLRTSTSVVSVAYSPGSHHDNDLQALAKSPFILL